jgi:chromosome segregation ATPase
VVTNLASVEPETGPLGPREIRRPRPLKKWAAAIVALAVFAGALGYVVDNEVQVNTEFDQAHHTLDVTRSHIDVTSADLATVRRELDVVKDQVGAASTAFTQDTAQLQGVQRALASAQANVTHQTSTITDLNVCLGGVEQALNALAVGDQTHAIDALNAVAASCANAVASDG